MCVPPVGTHSASGLLTALCQQTAALDCAGSARHTTRPSGCAQVAQLAEQGTENPRVGGSIPPLGTNNLLGSDEFGRYRVASVSRTVLPRTIPEAPVHPDHY